jgi:hypothetical protein
MGGGHHKVVGGGESRELAFHVMSPATPRLYYLKQQAF